MNVTTTSTPGRTRRPRKPRARRLATFAVIAASAVSALGLAAGPAMADTPLTNGPTIQIGQFTPVAAYDSTSVLPGNSGDTGIPAQIFVRSNTTQTDQSLTADLNGVGGAGAVSTSDETRAPAFRDWYFQRIGYVGLSTPESAELDSMSTFSTPSTWLQAAPVYHIVSNMSAVGDGPNCLTAMATAAGSTVASESCYSDSPSQMWVVGSTGATDQYLLSGQLFNMPLDQQWFSTALQPGGAPSPGSVIENVAALAADGWNSNTAPVLAATGNLPGINSAVTLEAQDWPTIGSNATWLLSAVNMASPTTSSQAYGSTSSAPAQCSMFSCLIGN
jgi:hypothetical protein